MFNLKYYYISLTFFILSNFCLAQNVDIDSFKNLTNIADEFLMSANNLIPNSSFEKYSQCPVFCTLMPKSYFVDDWTLPTIGTSDYFNACSYKAGVPSNWAGFLKAHSGKGYVGFIIGMYNKQNHNYDVREYIQTKLSMKLEKDKLYYIKFYTALGQNARFAIDAIGMYISDKEIDTTNFIEPLPFKPQISNRRGAIIKNTSDWKEISGFYIANGNEKAVIIGNFYHDKDITWTLINHEGNLNYAYYLIDDVYFIKVDEEKVENYSAKEFIKYLETGNPLKLDDILFEVGKYNLGETFINKLTNLADFLSEHQEATVFLEGNTDNSGEEHFNDELSMNRAIEVMKFLIGKGISKNRIKYEFYGENRPTADNNTAEGRTLNRRVEITISR